MRSHMFKYHVAIPLGVIAVLVVFGLPVGSAVSAGVAVGCISMVLMMFTGHGHSRGHSHHEAAHRDLDAMTRHQ